MVVVVVVVVVVVMVVVVVVVVVMRRPNVDAAGRRWRRSVAVVHRRRRVDGCEGAAGTVGARYHRVVLEQTYFTPFPFENRRYSTEFQSAVVSFSVELRLQWHYFDTRPDTVNNLVAVATW